MQRKRKPKQKTKVPRPWVPSQEEKALLDSLAAGFQDRDPAEIAREIPNARVAQELVGRLPVEDPSSLPLIESILASFDDKHVVKAAKKALFRLKKRGISVADLFFDKAPGSILKPPQQEKPFAMTGPVNQAGYRGVMVVFQRSTKGTEVALGIINDEKGMSDFVFGTVSKKRLKELKDYLTEQAGPLVEISLPHASTILEETYKRHLEVHQEAPNDYLELRPWLLENAHPLGTPAIYQIIPEASFHGEPFTQSKLERLFDHELMEPWLIEPNELEPMLEEMAGVEDSPIVLNEIQKSERIRQIKEKWIHELFPPWKRLTLKRRLEEMAYVLVKIGDEEYARLCLMAAGTVDREHSTLRQNFFLEFLLDCNIDYYESISDRDAQKESPAVKREIPLIVSP